IRTAPPRQRTHAVTAKLEQHWRSELCRSSTQDSVRILQGNHQGSTTDDRIAKTQQQPAIGRRCHAFDVETTRLLRGTTRGSLHSESRQPLVGNHVRNQKTVGCTDKRQRSLSLGQLRRKKSKAGGRALAL